MEKNSSKSTILTICVGFIFIFVVFSFYWTIIVALTIGIIGIFSPYLSSKIEWIWMKIAMIIGYIMPNILLTLVYFIILTPISMVFRLFNKDPLMLSQEYNSYFKNTNKVFDKEYFKKIW